MSKEIQPENRDYLENLRFKSRLHKAGFLREEVSEIFKLSSVQLGTRESEEVCELSEEFFSFISETLADSRSRELVVSRMFFKSDAVEGTDPLHILLLDLYSVSSFEPNMPKNIEQVVGGILPASNDRIDLFDTDLRICLQVLRDDEIFEVFSRDVDKLLNFVKSSSGDQVAWYKFEKYANIIHSAPNKKIFLNNLKESALAKLLQIPLNKNGFSTILSDKPKTEYANKLLGAEVSTWHEKFLLLPKILNFVDLPIVKTDVFESSLLTDYAKRYAREMGLDVKKVGGSIERLSPEKKYIQTLTLLRSMESDDIQKYKRRLAKKLPNYEVADKKTLERVKRRENPHHPLNTLGVARTVGYEIEFEADEDARLMNRQGLFELLWFGGFKSGDGGSKSFETSPGPFYDPLTANLVFGAYCDAGIVDLMKYENFTYHFNVGIRGVDVTPLIRGMYLTGAAHNPNRSFKSDRIQIYPNYQNGVVYTECKSFEAITKKDFEWNMKSASFLSWALNAHEKKVPEEGLNKWDLELSDIWQEYSDILDEGLASIDIRNHLDETMHTPSAEIVKKQLRLIFPKKSFRYKELGKVGITEPGILGIYARGNYWPNLAYFAREVADNAVAKIEALADKLEKEVMEDIKEIEKWSLSEREFLIAEFRDKYKAPTYKLTKAVFLGA